MATKLQVLCLSQNDQNFLWISPTRVFWCLHFSFLKPHKGFSPAVMSLFGTGADLLLGKGMRLPGAPQHSGPSRSNGLLAMEYSSQQQVSEQRISQIGRFCSQLSGFNSNFVSQKHFFWKVDIIREGFSSFWFFIEIHVKQ